MKFALRKFKELSNEELYRIMQLRSEVFVVEQNCVYLDQDNIDLDAFHVLGFHENEVIHAYTRIVPPGIIYPEYISIGRVITSSKIRKLGFGKDLMKFTIFEALRLFPSNKIKISAQSYLIRFYNDLGFVEIGEEYLEDGIPHIKMIYK